jgi:lactoylglutathione lyase
MELGNFSVSLAIKDIEASKLFYEQLGFTVFMGDQSQNWLIMKNGDHVIGLFQGMFEKNILTFNPGWDSNAQKLDSFTDVRDIQRQLKQQDRCARTSRHSHTVCLTGKSVVALPGEAFSCVGTEV